MLRLKTMLVLGPLFAACGAAEIRIDQTRGVPAVKGSTTIALGAFTCGNPIAAGDQTVTTRAVDGGCELSYDQDVPVLTTAEYANIPELKGVVNLVQRVELSINSLTFTDGESGAALDVATRITSVSMAINGQLVADKAALTSLPRVISLQGDALTPLKAAVDARQAVTVRVRVVVVVPTTPAPPAKLKVAYDAQPAVIIGPGTISF